MEIKILLRGNLTRQDTVAPDTLTGETWLCKSHGGAVGRPDVNRTAEMLGACTYLFLERGTTLLRLAPLLTSDEEGEGSIWRCRIEACAPSPFPSCTHSATARGARIVNLRIASIALIPHSVAAIPCAGKYRRLSLSFSNSPCTFPRT